jgi:hypothetical protein
MKPEHIELRDFYAGLAMQGILSNGGIYGHLDGNGDPELNAKLAWEYATALIAEKEKRDNQ